jgi:hypothetical protein
MIPFARRDNLGPLLLSKGSTFSEKMDKRDSLLAITLHAAIMQHSIMRVGSFRGPRGDTGQF